MPTTIIGGTECHAPLIPGITGQDPLFFRPAEVDLLIADPTRARGTFGWEPKVGFQELIEAMVDADLEAESTPHHRTR